MEFRKSTRVLKAASSKHKNVGNEASQHSKNPIRHESSYEENSWQAPMHKGRTQEAETAGFELEFELQDC